MRISPSLTTLCAAPHTMPFFLHNWINTSVLYIFLIEGLWSIFPITKTLGITDTKGRQVPPAKSPMNCGSYKTSQSRAFTASWEAGSGLGETTLILYFLSWVPLTDKQIHPWVNHSVDDSVSSCVQCRWSCISRKSVTIKFNKMVHTFKVGQGLSQVPCTKLKQLICFGPNRTVYSHFLPFFSPRVTQARFHQAIFIIMKMLEIQQQARSKVKRSIQQKKENHAE